MEAPSLNTIKELCDGDEQYEKDFIALLKGEFPKDFKEYHTYINEQNFDNAFQIVHKIKHKFNILSLSESYKFAVIYEAQLKQKDASLHDDFTRLLDIVEEFINSL